MNSKRISRRRAPARPASSYRFRWSHLAIAGLLGAASCGVTEHAHDQEAVDPNQDFGPLGGAPAVGAAGSSPVATAGASANAGAVSATGGSAGAAAVGGSAGSALSAGGAGGAGGAPGMAGSPGVAGGPPLSGVVINLGGVDVPKERAIAFIHIGHSNMAGRGTTPVASRPYHTQETHPHAFTYHVGTPPVLALEPKTAGDGAGGAGPGTSLVKQAAVLSPNYYFISLGFGMGSAYCSQFIPGHLYYDQLIAAPKAIKGRVTFGAIFIYLGTTERHGTAADSSGFANCINTLVTAIRNDVGVPNLPMLINDYEVDATGEFALGGTVATTMMPQIAKIPSTVSNSALVSAAGIAMQDDHHFNLDGQFTWAQRALLTMQQKGWFPWPAK